MSFNTELNQYSSQFFDSLDSQDSDARLYAAPALKVWNFRLRLQRKNEACIHGETWVRK